MANKRFATKDDLLAIASEASEKYLDAADYHRALTWGEAKDRYTWGTIKGASDTSGQTTTANLQLVKPGYGSSLDIASINANSDTLDTAIKAVQDATDALEDARANLNALLGTLGLNAQGQPLIDAASARSTLGAATDGNSGTTLYAAQQAIATNASAISTLQSSVAGRYAGDLNDLKTACMRYCPQASTNRPVNAGGFLLVWEVYSGYVAQLFIANNDNNPQTFVRICNNGPWGSWHEIMRKVPYEDFSSKLTYLRNGVTATCWRINNIAFVKAEANGGVELSSGWNNLCTLPSGYRPPGHVYSFGKAPTLGTIEETSVLTDGKVRIYSSSASTSASLRLSITFPLSA